MSEHPKNNRTADAASGLVRRFESGATRDTDEGKFDYEGFLSPRVLEAFGAYMHKNRLQKNGNLRDSDDWQRGMGLEVYMKSAWRHFFSWWKHHRNNDPQETVDDICALIFNAQGYLHELLGEEAPKLTDDAVMAEIIRETLR